MSRAVAPKGIAELDGVLLARPATPELLMVPRDWMMELIRYVRALEAEVLLLRHLVRHISLAVVGEVVACPT